jgi:hypothetical protein
MKLQRTIDCLNGKLVEIVETRDEYDGEVPTVVVRLLEDASPAYPKGSYIEVYPYEIDKS